MATKLERERELQDLEALRAGKIVSGVRLRKNKDGIEVFYARVRINGKDTTENFSDYKKAKDFASTVKKKIYNGEAVDIGKIKKTLLKTIFELYLQKNPNLDKTKTGRINMISEEIGNTRLLEFRTKPFEDYLNWKKQQPVSQAHNKTKDSKPHKFYKGNMVEKNGELVLRTYAESTMRKIYYDIKGVLEWHAREKDYPFDYKPFKEVSPSRAWANKRKRRFEDGELQKLLKGFNCLYKNVNEAKLLTLFLYFSGFRLNETMLIKWKDIKLNEKIPEKSIIFIPAENQKTSETESVEDRDCVLRPQLYKLVSYLFKHWKKNAKPDDVVFSFWADGSYFSKKFKNATERAGIKGFTPRDLRREGISWYFENTLWNLLEIQKQVGHFNPETTAGYANRLNPEAMGKKLYMGLNV